MKFQHHFVIWFKVDDSSDELPAIHIGLVEGATPTVEEIEIARIEAVRGFIDYRKNNDQINGFSRTYHIVSSAIVDDQPGTLESHAINFQT